ncbi:hypothetical protein T484DRAFT_1797553 [Baffinella frigidus]|nr:hypothetical protein T484DRAFT_1797553 [Cryptophyta sp. CCMP2293]
MLGSIWEHADTGVPDCICRDLLEKTGQRTVAFCSLKQSCENALRDWNKVFGEGYMAPGGADEWNTESPARSCTKATFDIFKQQMKYEVEPCGKVVTAGNLADERKWHWVPGDVPVENKRYQGYRAGDNAIQEGLMAGSTVYPGTNHTPACQVDAGSDTCLNSPQLKWKAPDSARQADCMFAVLRGICAYHFWDCDASYSDKIFNSVSTDSC